MDDDRAHTVDSVLRSRDASAWLRRAVLDLLDRDPIDALNDVEALAEVMAHRADMILHAATGNGIEPCRRCGGVTPNEGGECATCALSS